MARVNEIAIGARFGDLTVIGERITNRQARVLVRCDCGTEKIVYVHHLGGLTRSCGCKSKAAARKHGMSHTPEFRAWEGAIQRCTNPRSENWKDYGGRGITVHPAWLADFQAFFEYVGPRPSAKHSLDRIDVNGNYEPGNLRWATATQQANNRRLRTSCKKGHLLEGENLRVYADGRRLCVECVRRWAGEGRARRRQAKSEARSGDQS